jgi:hypothetical protein
LGKRKTLNNNVTVRMDSDPEDDTPQLLLQKRHDLTEALSRQPYDLIAYLERAAVHTDLGYPDLAAGDAYRALLLTDEIRDESFEYHEQALEALRPRCVEGLPTILQGSPSRGQERPAVPIEEDQDGVRTLPRIAHEASKQCYRRLSISLLLCGCLKSAHDFCTRGLAIAPDDPDLLFKKDHIRAIARRRLKVDDVDINGLPDQGLVRREIYPWNDHEPNRFSPETLDFLNGELMAVAPKCEVRATELPTLIEGYGVAEGHEIATNKQLGLFAKHNVNPGETLLDEYSVLTVNNRLKESLCDACSTELTPLEPGSTVVGCPDCEDIMFCDENCLTRAGSYHPSICDKDIDTVARDPDPKETPNALYLLLLARSLAMSETQECHPLDLKEIKYIWGDFLPSAANAVPLSLDAPPPPIWTLPFSFASNISGPIHILEKMDVDIFASLAEYDLWIFNTLYSKFRGTASARVNKRDGRVEVAAVHPLWCLANHDCDPNVRWEWGGQMKFWCREKRVGGATGGIKKGEEILSHYCDIDLKVKERREWAEGSLGGWCMCARCRREAEEEKALNGHDSEDTSPLDGVT